MTTPAPIEQPESSLARDWLRLARYHLGTRNRILALSAVAIVAGLALNWSWLVATGMAPILLAALPCAVMCGLGLCANKLFGASCATESRPTTAPDQPVQISAQPDRAQSVTSASPCCTETADTRAAAQDQFQSDKERRDLHA